jgi:hypothetical protein
MQTNNIVFWQYVYTILYHFGDRLFSVQVAITTNKKYKVKNTTIKSPKWYSRPNNREKRLPEPLAAWKPGRTFYSVFQFLSVAKILKQKYLIMQKWLACVNFHFLQ